MMKVHWVEPAERFEVTSFSSEIVDGMAGAMTTVYECPRCGTKLGFTKDNFETRSARRVTNLDVATAAALDEAAVRRGIDTPRYLDWSCTRCGLAVRAYVRGWAAGRGDFGVDIIAVAEVRYRDGK
jgi:hypothetical protein